jgi:DUF1009 family protein
MTGPLGILAGGGKLPGRVAAAAVAAGREVFIIGFEDFAEASVIGAYPHAYARLGAAGKMLALLRAHGCAELCLIGPVKRPGWLDLRPDAEGARLLARVGRAAFMGDDGLLAAIVRVLADEGFKITGAHEILTDAVGGEGLLGQVAASAEAMSDIDHALTVLKALGAVDVGQGCVVQQGVVLAVEALEGTDKMLERVAPLRRPGFGGVLVKRVKPGQERRADLPTIGPRTAENAARAGLAGIAFEAGGTLIIDRAATIHAADEAGIFLLGVDVKD